VNATRLVVHHTYNGRHAFDVSENGNHGRPTAVARGTGAFGGSYLFSGGPSRVDIRPSPTLRQLRSVRVRVRFFPQPTPAGSLRRHNLVEGHLSFALFLNPDGSVQGTIVRRTGGWDGPRTGTGMVVPNQWNVVEFFHDGISYARLALNNSPLTERFDIPGPVRDVGPNGVAIGHWPEPDDRYTLEGWIDDVRIWAWDPKKEVDDTLDRCCFDRDVLDKLAKEVRAQGWKTWQLGQTVRHLKDIGTEIATRARDSDVTRIARANQIARDALLGIQRGDRTALGVAVLSYDAFARERMSQAEIVNYGNAVLTVLRASPLGDWFPATGPWGVWSKIGVGLGGLMAALCLDDLMPTDGKGEGRPEGPTRPSGDPMTDGDPKDPPPDWEDDPPVDPEA
jgi:hypothetical protein